MIEPFTFISINVFAVGCLERVTPVDELFPEVAIGILFLSVNDTGWEILARLPMLVNIASNWEDNWDSKESIEDVNEVPPPVAEISRESIEERTCDKEESWDSKESTEDGNVFPPIVVSKESIEERTCDKEVSISATSANASNW